MQDLDRASDQTSISDGTSVALADQLKSAGEVIMVSINGRPGLPIRDKTSFQQLVELLDRLETVEMLGERLRDLEAGKPLLTMEEAKDAVRSRYGISL